MQNESSGKTRHAIKVQSGIHLVLYKGEPMSVIFDRDAVEPDGTVKKTTQTSALKFVRSKYPGFWYFSFWFPEKQGMRAILDVQADSRGLTRPTGEVVTMSSEEHTKALVVAGGVGAAIGGIGMHIAHRRGWM